MILDIYKDAFEYSAKDLRTLLILGVICLFSFLLIPVFLLAGYNYRVINTAVRGIINGRDPLPDFDDVIRMFIDGIKVVIVQVIYWIVPAVAFIVFILIAGQLSGVLESAVVLIGCLVTLILGIIACLMTQMGLCHMAYNDGAFTKAFAFEEIKDVINEIGLFKCLLTYVGIIIICVVLSIVVTGIIGLIFTVFGISGAVLGADAGRFLLLGTLVNAVITTFIVGPYLNIFAGRSIGLLYTMQI